MIAYRKLFLATAIALHGYNIHAAPLQPDAPQLPDFVY